MRVNTELLREIYSSKIKSSSGLWWWGDSLSYEPLFFNFSLTLAEALTPDSPNSWQLQPEWNQFYAPSHFTLNFPLYPPILSVQTMHTETNSTWGFWHQASLLPTFCLSLCQLGTLTAERDTMIPRQFITSAEWGELLSPLCQNNLPIPQSEWVR